MGKKKEMEHGEVLRQERGIMSENRRCALVTGCARRIGAAICHALAREGWKVGIHYNSSGAEAAELEAKIVSAHGESACKLFQADIADKDARAALMDCVSSEFGRLDLLVNNASIYTRVPLEDLTMAELERYHKIHVEAPASLSLLFRKTLAKAAPGRIINILDIFADFPRKGYLPYCSTKAGLKGLTRQLALELAPDILVNGVSPGAILPPEESFSQEIMDKITARIPMGRFGEPEDIADAVVFLAQSRYITGQVIAVDGGRSVNI